MVHNAPMSEIKQKWRIPSSPPAKAPARSRVDDIPGLELDPLPRKALREVRRRLDLSQRAFAAAVGVSLRTVKAWEHPDPNNSEARNCTGSARVLIRLIASRPDLLDMLEP